MIVLPDLAEFPDFLHEPSNITNNMPYIIGPMMDAIKANDYEKFVSELELEDVEWVRRLRHFFDFYQTWKRPNWDVEEMHDGLYVTQHDVGYLKSSVQPIIDDLIAQPDHTPEIGRFDRFQQLPEMCSEVHKLFEQLGIIQMASAYNRRPMSVANVVLHVAKPTDKNWKQFMQDATTTPKYTNAHIDPKEDVVKAMIYLNDVTTDNGAFHYYKGSNREEIHPVQNIFGRAISTGSYCHNPESRRTVFRLPRGLRVSHNFGRQVMPNTAWEQTLDENLKPVTSEEGNIMVFDPGAGIHQGGICKSGTRLALQILMK
jgi:hypothetical protein